MPDLTAPFIGYPRAPQPKKGPPKLYEDTWLDDFFKGFLGQEQPGGSVLEPDRAERVARNQIGQIAGIGGDALGFAKPVALAGAGLAGLMALNKAPAGSTIGKGLGKNQAGAITIGGAKDLYASHAFDPSHTKDIVKSGHLDAPSIGISSREANDYSPDKPQFIFRPGSIDSNKQFGTLVNRDGYFSNPHSAPWPGGPADPEFLKQEVARMLKLGKDQYGVDDLRLGQGSPGAGQGLAIAASPAFKSFKQFEKSLYGAAALRKSPKIRQKEWDDLNRAVGTRARELGQGSDEYVENFLRQRAAGEGVFDEERQLWQKAKASPSAMAEFKLYEQLPLNPRDQAIFVPQLWDESTLRPLAPLRDAGFEFFTSGHFPRGVPKESWQMGPDNTFKHLPQVASSTGELLVPKKLQTDFLSQRSTDIWNDFMNPKAGGSPPLAFAPKPLSSVPNLGPKKGESTAQPLSGADYEEFFGMPDPKGVSPGIFDPMKFFDSVPKAQEPWGAGLQLKGLQTPLMLKKLENEADEYVFVIDEILKKHKVPPAEHDALVEAVHDAYTMGYHKHPNWHQALEDLLGGHFGASK